MTLFFTYSDAVALNVRRRPWNTPTIVSACPVYWRSRCAASAERRRPLLKGDSAEVPCVVVTRVGGGWHSYPQTPAEQAKEEAAFKEGLRALSERERSTFWPWVCGCRRLNFLHRSLQGLCWEALRLAGTKARRSESKERNAVQTWTVANPVPIRVLRVVRRTRMTAAVMAAAMKMKMMPKPAEPGLTTLNHLYRMLWFTSIIPPSASRHS